MTVNKWSAGGGDMGFMVLQFRVMFLMAFGINLALVKVNTVFDMAQCTMIFAGFVFIVYSPAISCSSIVFTFVRACVCVCIWGLLYFAKRNETKRNETK